jgi:hypothetical protein
MTVPRMLLLWCICAAAALSGCASTPQASPERDAEAKRFVAHPASAAVYVYRSDFRSGDDDWTQSVLWIDDRLIGQTLPGTYYRVDLRPGAHRLRGDGPDQGRLTINTAAGQVYFVRLNVVTGTSRFTLVDPATGRKENLGCCALLENWAPGQRPFLR